MAAISATLSGLADAADELMPHRLGGGTEIVLGLQGQQLGQAQLGQPEQAVQLPGEKAMPSAVPWTSTKRVPTVRAGQHHHVHVHLGRGVLDIGQVQDGYAVDDAHADRGAQRVERMRPDLGGLHEPGEGVVEGQVAAADRRRAGAAVGLEHVAVDRDLTLAQEHQVADGAQGPPDQPLDLLVRPPWRAPTARGRPAPATSRAAWCIRR